MVIVRGGKELLLCPWALEPGTANSLLRSKCKVNKISAEQYFIF